MTIEKFSATVNFWFQGTNITSNHSQFSSCSAFADPYDLSVRGYVNNLTYFLGYSGVGWGFLWVVHVGWFLRHSQPGGGGRGGAPVWGAGSSEMRLLITGLVVVMATDGGCDHGGCDGGGEW